MALSPRPARCWGAPFGLLRMGQVLVVGAAALLALGALYLLRSWAGMIVALLVLGAGGALIYLPFEGRHAGGVGAGRARGGRCAPVTASAAIGQRARRAGRR